jgi:ABC-2 type transport system ATP-binding protein
LGETFPAVQTLDLVKRYSGRANSLLGAYQLKSLVSTIRGSSERTVLALNGVNLSIFDGEVFGLLGPNGAGKTTLIKILSTLVLPDSGRALVKGVDVVKRPKIALTILQTVLSESAGFERRLTGRQNLEFYATLYGLPRKESRAKIEELLDFFNMRDKADMLFQKYSTGLGRRLLICRVLLSNASIILFDEPTSGLDPVVAAEFRRLLKQILSKEKGKTVILATHNLSEAQQICDRIAVLNKGKIKAVGTPAEIREFASDRTTISVGLVASPSLSRQEFLEKLKGISGVTDASMADDVGEGNFSLSVEGEKDMDYNHLFAILLSTRFRISWLESSQPTLEEAFLKLTSEVQAAQ